MEINTRVLKIGFEHILEVANERKAVLKKLKTALIADDTEKIKEFAKQLCGLSNESC